MNTDILLQLGFSQEYARKIIEADKYIHFSSISSNLIDNPIISRIENEWIIEKGIPDKNSIMI
jgi:hypothetical protein